MDLNRFAMLFLLVVFMGKMLGYMLTWTTYGTWLQGDERGWVKDGETLGANAGLKRSNEERMIQSAVRLNSEQKEVVRRSVLEQAERVGQEVLALAVWSTHVHVVLGANEESIEEAAGYYKNGTRKALHDHGLKGKVWTKGYGKRFCYDEGGLEQKIAYVQGHGD